MDPTKVDVLLPVRNGAKYIGEALASIQPDIDAVSSIIIVDDGSTDDTVAIVNNFQPQSKIRLYQQAQYGLVAALNRALRLSRAEYIARMDADDISLPGRLPAQLAYLETHRDVAVVGTQIARIGPGGESLGSRTTYPCDNESISLQLMQKGCVVSHPTVMARRAALLQCGGYRNAFKDAEDYDLWLRVIEQAAIANLPEVFLKYRQHPGQVSNARNLRQSFSRDLARWCAAERRSGRPDPALVMEEPPSYADLRKQHRDPTNTLAQLAIAYEALAKYGEGTLEASCSQAFRIIPSLAHRRYLGDTRRVRYQTIKWVARSALQNFRLLDAASAFITLVRCRIQDSKLFRRLQNPAAQPMHPET